MQIKDGRVLGLIASHLGHLSFGHAGNVAAVGQGISELRIHYGPGYRVYFQKRGDTIIVLLGGGDKDYQTKSRQQNALLRNGVNVMTEKLTAYDPAADLVSDEAMATFMTAALQTNDASYIAHALGIVARAKGMAQIAAQTGLSREQL